MLRQKERKPLQTALRWAALAAAFALLCCYWQFWLPNQLDADMSSEQILANLLAKSPGLPIFSAGWYYSTELRALNTQLVMAPLFRLLGGADWHLVRVAGSVVLVLLYLAAYLSFARSLRLRSGGVYGAALLLLPFGALYRQYVLGGLYYIPHLAINFACVACLLCAAHSKGVRRAAAVAGLCLLSLLAGVGGPRQLVILQIPLTLAVLALAVADRVPGRGLRHMLRGPRGPLLGTMVLADAAGAAGYAVNALVLSGQYAFQDQSYIAYGNLTFERLEQLLNGLLAAFGWQKGAAVSPASPFNLLVLVLLGFSFWFAWRLLRGRGRYPLEHRLLGAFYCCLAVCFLFLYALTNMGHSDRYLLPLSVLFIPLAEIYFTDRQAETGVKTSVLAGALLLALALRGGAEYGGAAQEENPNAGSTQFLLESGCTQGYASFWDGNIMTELSNGQIEVWSLAQNNELELRRWLQPKEHLTSAPQGRIFFVISKWEEWGERQPTAQGLADAMPEEALAYEDGYHKIYLFESDAAMHEACGWAMPVQ